eukprot:COSAG01_NODE_541_length_15735_cov_4.534088_10_plen_512_part_00
MPVLLLLWALTLALTVIQNANGDGYPLIEASGVDPFALSGWDLLIGGTHLCGTNSSGALLLSTNGSAVRLLRGPTPHTVGEGSIAAPTSLGSSSSSSSSSGENAGEAAAAAAAVMWRAGVAIDNYVVLLRAPTGSTSGAGGYNLAVVTVSAGCASIISVQWATVAPLGAEWAGAATTAATTTGRTATVFSVATLPSKAPRLVAIDLNLQNIRLAKPRSRLLASIPAPSGCDFRGVAATKRGTLVAVAANCPSIPKRCALDASTAKDMCGPVGSNCGHAASKKPYQYGNPGYGIFCCAQPATGHCNSGPCCAVHGTDPGANDCANYPRCDTQWQNKTWQRLQNLPNPNVFELSADSGAVVNSTRISIQNSTDWMGVAVIDVAGNGREQILLPRRGGIDDGGERIAIVDWDPSTGALSPTLPHVGAVLGPPGRPGMEMDGMKQEWRSICTTTWLSGAVGQQLLALRAYSATLSGRQQAVNVLLFGSAMHVLPRRICFTNPGSRRNMGSDHQHE